LKVPPELQIFLWLLGNNKTLTRDNLAKRRNIEDESCLFCEEKESEEKESVYHLFFDCCVTKAMWMVCSEITSKLLGTDFESVAKFWLQEKSKSWLNVLTTVVFWSIWKFRNDVFSGKQKDWNAGAAEELVADGNGLSAAAKYRGKNGAGGLGGENGTRTGKAASTIVGVTRANRCRIA
jgi:hypothetical protein